MKIEFTARDNLVAFLNAILGIDTPFDFEVDGKKIEFFDLQKDDLSMLRAMASSEGGSVEEPPRRGPPRRDHVGNPHGGPFPWALCMHDVLPKDCTICIEREVLSLRPNMDALERAADILAGEKLRASPLDGTSADRARTLLSQAALTYSRAVDRRIRGLMGTPTCTCDRCGHPHTQPTE
jgi:hypothetical protein